MHAAYVNISALVACNWTVLFDTSIVYGLRDDSHDLKTAFWRCAHVMLALVPVVTRQNPGQTLNFQVSSRPSNDMLITNIIMAEAESQKI